MSFDLATVTAADDAGRGAPDGFSSKTCGERGGGQNVLAGGMSGGQVNFQSRWELEMGSIQAGLADGSSPGNAGIESATATKASAAAAVAQEHLGTSLDREPNEIEARGSRTASNFIAGRFNQTSATWKSTTKTPGLETRSSGTSRPGRTTVAQTTERAEAAHKGAASSDRKNAAAGISDLNVAMEAPFSVDSTGTIRGEATANARADRLSRESAEILETAQNSEQALVRKTNTQGLELNVGAGSHSPAPPADRLQCSAEIETNAAGPSEPYAQSEERMLPGVGGSAKPASVNTAASNAATSSTVDASGWADNTNPSNSRLPLSALAIADAHENETLARGNAHAPTSMGNSPEDGFSAGTPGLSSVLAQARTEPAQSSPVLPLDAHAAAAIPGRPVSSGARRGGGSSGSGSMAESDGRLRSEKGHAASLSEVTPVDVASTGATAGANSSKADAGEPGKRGFTPDEVFSTLDSAPNGVRPEWRHASGTRAEAGFNDPALGWVGVRAEKSGTNVQATLVPGSEPAADALQGHVHGLSTYLSEQNAGVGKLTVAMPEHGDRGSAGGSGPDSNGHGNGGAFDQPTGEGGRQDGNAGAHPDARLEMNRVVVRSSGLETRTPAAQTTGTGIAAQDHLSGGSGALDGANTEVRRDMHVSVVA